MIKQTFSNLRKGLSIKDKKYKERVNQDITAYQIRVIDESGNPLGILSPVEANRIAMQRGLDLVEISPNAKPPVCKIIDYGKFNYERQKKEKLQKKNQIVMTVKEIRFNANTDTHDIEFKTKHLKQFLIDGHKVKASVLYKGRMITHPEIGQKLMTEILEIVNEVGKIEAPPKLEGKMLVTYLIPDKNKIQTFKNKLAKEKKLLEKQKLEKPEIKVMSDGEIKPDEAKIQEKEFKD